MSARPEWHFLGNGPENYERYLVPSIFAPWADLLVELAALRPGEHVLDIACGTGIVARIAARKLHNTGSVTGTDSSASMLVAAHAAAQAEGVEVEWQEGSAGRLPFADRTFDVLFCQQGLQFFPDRPGALREMRRALRPGGRLVLSVWGPIERSRGFAVLAEALTHHISPEAGGMLTAGPFGLSSAGELRTLMADAGFNDIAVTPIVKTLQYPSSDDFVLRYVSASALSGIVDDADEKSRTAMLAEVGMKLASAGNDTGLRFSIEANVVIAYI